MAISTEVEIGTSFIDCATYEQFIRYQQKASETDSEEISIEKLCLPYHWDNPYYESGHAMKPLVGILAEDAEVFCQWANQEYLQPRFRYRLPTPAEAERYPIGDGEIGYWCKDQFRVKLEGLRSHHLDNLSKKISKIFDSDCSNEIQYIYNTNFNYSHDLNSDKNAYLKDAIYEIREISDIRDLLAKLEEHRYSIFFIVVDSIILALFKLLIYLKMIIRVPFYLGLSALQSLLRIFSNHFIYFLPAFLFLIFFLFMVNLAIDFALDLNLEGASLFIKNYEEKVAAFQSSLAKFLSFMRHSIPFIYMFLCAFLVTVLIDIFEYATFDYLKYLQDRIKKNRIMRNSKKLKPDREFDSKVRECLELGNSLSVDIRDSTHISVVKKYINLFQRLAEIYEKSYHSPNLLPEDSFSINTLLKLNERWLSRRNRLLSLCIFSTIVRERKLKHIPAFEGIRLVKERVQ